MRCLALLSGGKDSVYAAHIANEWGHEVVVAGNLAPSDKGVEELDSWTFQTVGHLAVPAVSAAMGVPLLQACISLSPPLSVVSVPACIVGSSVSVGITYTETKGDEIEDLARLVAYARDHYAVQGVVCGALFSTYQRNRVESICERLGLTSIAPLWRVEQDVLLDRMDACGHSSILVKISSEGLTTTHLGKTLVQMRPMLDRLNEDMETNVAGEGGEYETLTIASPGFVNGRHLVITESENIEVTPDKWAPVAHMRVTGVEVQESDSTPVAIPPVIRVPDDYTVTGPTPSPPLGPVPGVECRCQTVCGSGDDGVTRAVIGVTCPVDSVSLEAATHAAISRIQAELLSLSEARGLSPALSLLDVVSVFVGIPSAAQFEQFNSVYKALFQGASPVRSCVEVHSGDTAGLTLSVLVVRGVPTSSAEPWRYNRQTLCVRSRSDWAPVVVGPYSQGCAVGDVLFVSGQIPLVPRHMTVLPEDGTLETYPPGHGQEDDAPTYTPAGVTRRHIARVLDEYPQYTMEDCVSIGWRNTNTSHGEDEASSAGVSLPLSVTGLPLNLPVEISPLFIRDSSALSVSLAPLFPGVSLEGRCADSGVAVCVAPVCPSIADLPTLLAPLFSECGVEKGLVQVSLFAAVPATRFDTLSVGGVSVFITSHSVRTEGQEGMHVLVLGQVEE
ncbi:diphthine--ammonia ligase/Uncharacterised protein MJ0570 [Kipferlia bialata]|uniref:Diphthine--ammonia ligase n=1 Tax=Kipferlia bialata TaxID=797122 RepID=A0A9K3GFN4_9EUKA|nr:diphthine--ammonia ligase/Uncharacterised protein MJ0570 [Kipferlia bialata]|eukprot:g1664.t1